MAEAEKKSGDAFAAFSQAGAAPKITSIFDLTAEALEELALWLEMRGLRTPITQVLGFQQFVAQTATEISTSETTTSTSFTDLATGGPEITGLPDGKYVIQWGGTIQSSSTAQAARMGVKVDTTEPSAGQSVASNNIEFASLGRSLITTLSGSPAGGHTLRARYKIDGAGTATFSARWLIALKYANIT